MLKGNVIWELDKALCLVHQREDFSYLMDLARLAVVDLL